MFLMDCGLKKIMKHGNTSDLISIKLPRDFNGTEKLMVFPMLLHNCSLGKNALGLKEKDLQYDLEFMTVINITSSASDTQIMYAKFIK